MAIVVKLVCCVNGVFVCYKASPVMFIFLS